MKPPLYIRHVTDAERAAREAGLRRSAAFTVRRCQIVLASAERQPPARSANTLRCAPPTVRHVLPAVDARGLACVPPGSNVPITVEPVRHAEKRAQVRAILHQSPRTCGQPVSVWTLKRRAEVCHGQGLSGPTLSCPTRLDALVRLGVHGSRATHGIVSPDPASERKKRRDRLLPMAANHPDLALGFEDDVWGSRAAQPHRHAWRDDTPVRLGEQTVPAKDPEGKAVAG